MKRKACKSCKLLSTGDECPQCHSGLSTLTWKGRLTILDAETSSIAKKIGVKKAGEYAIKVK